MFMGCPHSKKLYKLYNLDSNILFVSRDVIIHEEIFPFATLQLEQPSFPPSIFINHESATSAYNPSSDVLFLQKMFIPIH